MIACLFIPDFPAWVRQSQHPEWRKIAVFNRGLIVARTTLLKRSGLSIGEPLERARAIFPKACFFEQDHPMEQAAWENVLQKIHETTPFLSPVGQGCVYFSPFNFEEACDLAGALVAGIGLGPNRLIARIAAIRSAAGSVLQIKHNAATRFLASTKTNVVLEAGFEPKLVDRLALFGLHSLADVQQLTRKHLDAQFGQSGVDLFDFLHPSKRAEQVPLYTPPPAITETYNLDGAPFEWLPLEYLIRKLSGQAAQRLGNRHCKRIMLELTCRTGETRRVKQRILKRATSNSREIQRAALALAKQLVDQSSPEMEALTLTLTSLRTAQQHQPSLFFERPLPFEAISSIEDRFPGSVRRAVLVNPDAPFHEDAVRFVPVKPTPTIS